MACIFPRSPGLGRGGVAPAALDLGILFGVATQGVQKRSQVSIESIIRLFQVLRI